MSDDWRGDDYITIKATHPRVTGEQMPSQATLPLKMWYRVVDYIGPESNWEARLALLIRGDGPMLAEHGDPTVDSAHREHAPLLFETMLQVRQWGQAGNALYIIGLEPRR